MVGGVMVVWRGGGGDMSFRNRPNVFSCMAHCVFYNSVCIYGFLICT